MMNNTISRRTVVAGFLVAGVGLGAVSSLALAGNPVMTAPQALKEAKEKKLVLIDVRHPMEWKETGIGVDAVPISMHQGGFLAKLDKAIGGDKNKKIAIICATGSRSAYIQKELLKRGYSNVVSVAEGMVGGPNGKGWIPRGLPIKKIDIDAIK